MGTAHCRGPSLGFLQLFSGVPGAKVMCSPGAFTPFLDHSPYIVLTSLRPDTSHFPEPSKDRSEHPGLAACTQGQGGGQEAAVCGVGGQSLDTQAGYSPVFEARVWDRAMGEEKDSRPQPWGLCLYSYLSSTNSRGGPGSEPTGVPHTPKPCKCPVHVCYRLLLPHGGAKVEDL